MASAERTQLGAQFDFDRFVYTPQLEEETKSSARLVMRKEESQDAGTERALTRSLEALRTCVNRVSSLGVRSLEVTIPCCRMAEQLQIRLMPLQMPLASAQKVAGLFKMMFGDIDTVEVFREAKSARPKPEYVRENADMVRMLVATGKMKEVEARNHMDALNNAVALLHLGRKYTEKLRAIGINRPFEGEKALQELLTTLTAKIPHAQQFIEKMEKRVKEFLSSTDALHAVQQSFDAMKLGGASARAEGHAAEAASAAESSAAGVAKAPRTAASKRERFHSLQQARLVVADAQLSTEEAVEVAHAKELLIMAKTFATDTAAEYVLCTLPLQIAICREYHTWLSAFLADPAPTTAFAKSLE